MRSRTFFILVGILVLLAVAGWGLLNRGERERPSTQMGGYLMKNLQVNEIASIVVYGPKGKLTLKKAEGAWVVAERWGYPADFSRIADLLRKLKEVKVGRKFQSSEDVIARLSLADPQDQKASEKERGIRLELFDSKGEKRADLILGKERDADPATGQTGGRYVLRKGVSSDVYLVDWSISGPSEEPSSWLNRELLSVAADDIESIVCLAEEGKTVRYAFARPEKGKAFELKSPKSSGKINTSELDRLSDTLSNFRLSDVASRYEAGRPLEGFDESVRIEYHLYDGNIYRIYPGGQCKDAMCRFRLEVGFRGMEALSEKEDEKAKSPEERAKDAGKLNERLSAWVYVVPGWQHAVFSTELSAFLEKEEGAPGKASKKP